MIVTIDDKDGNQYGQEYILNKTSVVFNNQEYTEPYIYGEIWMHDLTLHLITVIRPRLEKEAWLEEDITEFLTTAISGAVYTLHELTDLYESINDHFNDIKKYSMNPERVLALLEAEKQNLLESWQFKHEEPLWKVTQVATLKRFNTAIQITRITLED